jgi:hypothetical protein
MDFINKMLKKYQLNLVKNYFINYSPVNEAIVRKSKIPAKFYVCLSSIMCLYSSETNKTS